MKLPNGPYALKSLLIVTLLSRFVYGASPTWISLNLSVPSALSDQELNQNFVDVNVGTPPQTLKLAIDVQADSISAYASDCAFCPGDTFFDYKASSTFKFNEERHLRTTNEFDGAWAFDTIGFGGVMQSTDVDLGLLRGISTNYSSIRTWNGDLGLLTNTFRNGTFKRLLADLNSTGQLLNPVLGMRFDPQNPKLTIGALDPNDYVGELNWVQIEDDQLDWFEFNVFKIDGFAGRNGSLLPFGDLTASLDSISSDIAIPDNSTYFNNSDYTGPIFNGTGGINFDPAFHIPSYPCKSNEVVFPGIDIPEAYVDFSVVINGVSYIIDSKDNLLRATSFFSPTGYCNVGISTYQGTTQPKSRLGLPFLRSVYVAYRFPTESCPGFYGFAFPSGLNRTKSQAFQKPASTPSQSAQCLSFSKPTSTPTVTRGVPPGSPTGLYAVYGQDGMQVPLKGTEFLAKGISKVTG